MLSDNRMGIWTCWTVLSIVTPDQYSTANSTDNWQLSMNNIYMKEETYRKIIHYAGYNINMII